MPIADEIRQYEARLAREPTAQGLAALADAYRRAGKVSEALALCRQGLARFPEYATTRWILAKALLDAGETAEARHEVERFLAGEPDHEPALRMATECALRLADPRGALQHLQRLVRLDPEDRGLQHQLVALEMAVLRRSGREAVPGLLGLLGDDIYATVTFGDLCQAQGLLDEATAVFSRIVLNAPDHTIARARLAELGRGRTQARRPRG